MVLKLTIEGQIPSKSNSYQIIQVHNKKRPGTKRCAMMRTKAVNDYRESFVSQVIEQLGVIKDPLLIREFGYSATVYFSSYRSDLDGHFKVVLDCLQEAKVIKNDRYLRNIRDVSYYVDKESPRIILTLTDLSEKS